MNDESVAQPNLTRRAFVGLTLATSASVLIGKAGAVFGSAEVTLKTNSTFKIGGDLEVTAVLANDTAWDETFGGVRGELRPPLAAPAEDLQFHQFVSYAAAKPAFSDKHH